MLLSRGAILGSAFTPDPVADKLATLSFARLSGSFTGLLAKRAIAMTRNDRR
jgi:hypothetical protein